MDRCPNCRARVNGADHCRRCGMALDLLSKVEEAAEAQLRAALRYLAHGDSDAASTSLRRLLSLRREPLAEQLLIFADTLRTPPIHGQGDVRQASIDETSRTLPNAFWLSE